MESKPIVVGVDGSADSERALRWAAEHARNYDAPLVALAAFDVPRIYGPMAMTGWQDPTELNNASRTMLAETVRNALGDDAALEQRVRRGHPAESLVQASKEAQHLVVGSRGHGGFTGLLLGSVSQHIIAHARCPVTVMPHGLSEQ